MQDSRFQTLFEPVQIGPVTAPNRFYQVPHCTGMGYRLPESLAAMRGIKAEGGWGVVCTEYCSMHPSSEDSPFHFATLWDGEDTAVHARMVDSVHAHGALAGVELWHGGSYVANLSSREPTLGVASYPNSHASCDPVQSRPMSLSDIRDLRRWQAAAAKRAMQAGFDIVYVYANHGYLLSEFLSRERNTRCDEYGGALENRVRLVRELIEETKSAVGHRCAVAVRYSLSAAGPEIGPEEETRAALALLADLPDLWDVTIDDYSTEMGSSRFVREAAQEETIRFVKQLTGKPVVGVGRFTSPDTMLRQVHQGVLDFIGAARPSIADPFLPRKIAEGRFDDIRECIGCNICYAHNSLSAPIRCTQNPTMGEEFRKGWHPEFAPRRHAAETVLVIGGGPAGLEAARTLGARGYEVTLAEASKELGGRVSLESRLPGLAEWARVRDWRLGQIMKLSNVSHYLDSRLTAEDVLQFGFDHVILATGARWRRDGTGRWHTAPFEGWQQSRVFTPDDLLDGRVPEGSVLLFDDDHYYMGSALALLLADRGCDVTYVTTEGRAAIWTRFTEELHLTNAALIRAGVKILTNLSLEAFDGSSAKLACVFTGDLREIPANSLVTVTARTPQDSLYGELSEDSGRLADAGILSLAKIGDCDAPSTIAAAVYAGHRMARELGSELAGDVPYRRELPGISAACD